MRTAILAAAIALAGCGGGDKNGVEPAAPARSGLVDEHVRRRQAMVREQMRDVTEPEVLRAMGAVPRHLFVPPGLEGLAYEDRPLSIGHEQTISQPYIVALMTQAARVKAGDRILEVGTGSGYQAAVLAELGCRVWTIEIVPELHRFAADNLRRTGYSDRVVQRCGDGYAGWPEEGPFDAIVVTAAPEEVPEPLPEQLREGGRLVIPVGPMHNQVLKVLRRAPGGLREELLIPVRFVPLVRRPESRR